MDRFVEQMIAFFGGAQPAFIVFLISLFPVVELRGGILAAGMMHVNIVQAYFSCLAGTLLPVPFILLFLNKILEWMRNTRLVKLVDRLEAKMEKKSKKVEKYKTFGLMIFVSVPLPGTGAWTGSVVAALMKMRFRRALLSIIVGCAVADAIMCAISYGLLSFVW